MSLNNIPARKSQVLIKLAREGGAEDFAIALREEGTSVMDRALETFFKMDREAEDAQAAIAGMQDLKKSLMTYIDRDAQELELNRKAASSLQERIVSGEEPALKLAAAEVQTLRNAEPIWGVCSSENHLLKDGRIEDGERRLTQETPHRIETGVSSLSGLKRFLRDLSSVQGLYAAVAMVPGPLSASVKSVAKELMTAKADFSASSQSSEVHGGVGLLPLGAFRGRTSGASNAQGSASAEFERSTVDERVVPVLMDLRDRLEQAEVEDGGKGKIMAKRTGVEFARETRKRLFRAPKVETKKISYRSDNSLPSRRVTDYELQSDRVRLPLTGVSDF